MRLYSICQWGSLYENNRSRELKKLDWFAMPNKQDSDGYTAIMDRKNGAAILGAFVACAQIASRCDPRGTLVRDGKKPHDANSLSRMSRIPAALIQETLDFCASDDVNWLEFKELPDTAAPSCEIPAPSREPETAAVAPSRDSVAPRARAGREGKEGKGEDRKNVAEAAPQPEVDGAKSRHHQFISEWFSAYEKVFGEKYANVEADVKIIQSFLKCNPAMEVSGLIEIAISAWALRNDRKNCFHCNQSTTIRTFLNSLNAIKREVEDEKTRKTLPNNGSTFTSNARPTGADIRRGPPSGTDAAALLASIDAQEAQEAAENGVAAKVA